jgi:hypothetical protein
MDVALSPSPLPDALGRVREAPTGLLALGIPLCPACELLTASLQEIAAHRPDLTVTIAALATPEEWTARETLLWPIGIHVSRASVPVLAVFRDGAVLATRQGGGPAVAIDAWLAGTLGPPERPFTDITDSERDRLDEVAPLRARHLAARSSQRQ